jgi:hypothetical protein
MQEGKKTYLVNKPGTSEFVSVAVAPGETTRDVLEAIGARGALGLSTAAAQPEFVLLPPAVLWCQIQEGARLYVVGSCPVRKREV